MIDDGLFFCFVVVVVVVVVGGGGGGGGVPECAKFASKHPALHPYHLHFNWLNGKFWLHGKRPWPITFRIPLMLETGESLK